MISTYDTYQEYMTPTIALNGVMSNSTQHGELGVFANTKPFSHPREEVGKTVVATLNALRNTRAPTCERQGGDAIWAKDNIGVSVGQAHLGLQNVFRLFDVRSADDAAISQQLQRRDLDAYLKLGRDEFADRRGDLACT